MPIRLAKWSRELGASNFEFKREFWAVWSSRENSELELEYLAVGREQMAFKAGVDPTGRLGSLC